MPAYSGKYQYLDEAGARRSQQGPCQLSFDEGTVHGHARRRHAARLRPGRCRPHRARRVGPATGPLHRPHRASSSSSAPPSAAWRANCWPPGATARCECLLLEDLEEVGALPGRGQRRTRRDPHLPQQSGDAAAGRACRCSGAWPKSIRARSTTAAYSIVLQSRRRATGALQTRQEDRRGLRQPARGASTRCTPRPPARCASCSRS